MAPDPIRRTELDFHRRVDEAGAKRDSVVRGKWHKPNAFAIRLWPISGLNFHHMSFSATVNRLSWKMGFAADEMSSSFHGANELSNVFDDPFFEREDFFEARSLNTYKLPYCIFCEYS